MSKNNPTSKKKNRTAAEKQAIRDAIYDVCEETNRKYGPIGVRSVFYQLVSRQMIEKTELQCQYVSKQMTEMRENGDLPWRWVKDESRTMQGGFHGHLPTRSVVSHRTRLISSIQPSLRYPEWYGQSSHVQIWCEKVGLTGILEQAIPPSMSGGVRIIPCGGKPSTTFVDEIALEISDHMSAGLDVAMFYFGDFDVDGRQIFESHTERNLVKKLPRYVERRLGREPDGLSMQWMAVTEEQIQELNLPTRPAKSKSASHDYDYSVELDAMLPENLISLVEECIWSVVDKDALENVDELNRAEHRKMDALRRRVNELCDELNDEGWEMDNAE